MKIYLGMFPCQEVPGTIGLSVCLSVCLLLLLLIFQGLYAAYHEDICWTITSFVCRHTINTKKCSVLTCIGCNSSKHDGASSFDVLVRGTECFPLNPSLHLRTEERGTLINNVATINFAFSLAQRGTRTQAQTTIRLRHTVSVYWRPILLCLFDTSIRMTTVCLVILFHLFLYVFHFIGLSPCVSSLSPSWDSV